jgi:hypothetical protein
MTWETYSRCASGTTESRQGGNSLLEELQRMIREQEAFSRTAGWTQLDDFEDLLDEEDRELFRGLAKECGFDGTTEIDEVLGAKSTRGEDDV